MKTVQVIISGKVQGVFFRATAKEIADANRISGWIKNTHEGNVEALITGEPDDIKRFLEWCNKGPEKAKVVSVSIDEKALQEFDGFKILR